MKRKETVKIEVEKEVMYCDSCNCKIGFSDENHQNYIEFTFKGTGYTTYGAACDTEWNYLLCRKCATALKDFLDNPKTNLQMLPEAEE